MKQTFKFSIQAVVACMMGATLTACVGCSSYVEGDAAESPDGGAGTRTRAAASPTKPSAVAQPAKEPYQPSVNVRELIEWVWKHGRQVEVQTGRTITLKPGDSFPAEPFVVIRIGLSHVDVHDADLARLQGLTSLRELSLEDLPITDAGLVHLRGLSSLQRLTLANANISDAGLVHVAGLTHLNSLDLDRTKITDAGLEHLAGLLWLQRLSLQGTAIDGSGFRHLRNLKSLSSLDLMGSGVTDAGLSHLAELTSLRSLLLLGAPVEGSGLRHLPDSLRQLSVDRLSDRDLVSIRALPFMTELHMRHARLSDEGLKVLLQAKTLEELSLGPDIGDRSVIYLCELDSLRRLHMESCRITKSGKDELDKALPMCTVYWTPPR